MSSFTRSHAMKRILSFFLILALCLVFSACGQESSKEAEPQTIPEPYAKYQALIEALEAGKYEQARAFIDAMDPTPAPAPTPAPYVESVKILYYSNDLTGSDFTMKLSQGEDGVITLKAEAYPIGEKGLRDDFLAYWDTFCAMADMYENITLVESFDKCSRSFAELSVKKDNLYKKLTEELAK